MNRSVVLRAEHSGQDSRYLRAYLDVDGNLHIDGQDLGPGTAMVSSDGEYEWFRTFTPDVLPRLCEVLEIDPEEDVLDQMLVRYAGPLSYELERRIRESDVPNKLDVWSG